MLEKNNLTSNALSNDIVQGAWELLWKLDGSVSSIRQILNLSTKVKKVVISQFIEDSKMCLGTAQLLSLSLRDAKFSQIIVQCAQYAEMVTQSCTMVSWLVTDAKDSFDEHSLENIDIYADSAIIASLINVKIIAVTVEFMINQRNSCRYCRFQRCLEVGMDPKAVRPDRDLTGRQRVPRLRRRQIDEELLNHMQFFQMRLQDNNWSQKLPVESRVLLMQLMNIESKTVKEVETSSTRNNNENSSKTVSLRELLELRPVLDSRLAKNRYEPYQRAQFGELPQTAHRGAMAAVDWVDSLADLADITDTEDKVALVKSCYSPLTIFNFSTRTAQNTDNPDILCLCRHVPRKLPFEFTQTKQLSDDLIDRTLNELVVPLRKLKLKKEEVVSLKAVIILNPNAKGLSVAAQQIVSDLRDRIQEVLFQVIKEMNPTYTATSRFGNLLLLLPTIMTLCGLCGTMSENLQFVQALARDQKEDNLRSEIFGDAYAKLDGPVPTLENSAEISLKYASSPYRPTTINGNMVNQGNLEWTRVHKLIWMTALKDHYRAPTYANRLPLLISFSPLHYVLDDDLSNYPTAPDYSDIHNDHGDLFFLMDDIK
ncbi:Nuclear hormone receptor family member nhr-31 [Dirofilaria immitis]|nr:Nuclear hormone receptor family member nhr-31 [Dirofilaria immitis]